VEALRAEGIAEASCTIYTGDNPEAFLIIDNRVALFADDNMSALDSLLTEIASTKETLWGTGFDDDLMQALLAGAAGVPEDDEEDEDEYDEDEEDEEDDEEAEAENAKLSKYDVPDVIFPSNNEFDIPLLDLRLAAQGVDNPVVKWGTISRHNTVNMGGTFHFYTEDYKFDALWKDPTPVVNCGVINAVEPNVSTHPTMARAIVIYGVYQKRWIARFWQSKGIRVFVDMNVEPCFNDLNLLGIPEGWTAYCTRGYSQRDDDIEIIEAQYRLACERAGTDQIIFWVYGGGMQVRDAAAKHQWVWVQEHLQEIEKKRDLYGIG
jgi:hypothetical protein